MNGVKIAVDQCKGCRVCIGVCPNHCLVVGSGFNAQGYQNTVFVGEARCTACGLCFYVCPEPGAITVYRGEFPPESDVDRSSPSEPGTPEGKEGNR